MSDPVILKDTELAHRPKSSPLVIVVVLLALSLVGVVISGMSKAKERSAALAGVQTELKESKAEVARLQAELAESSTRAANFEKEITALM